MQISPPPKKKSCNKTLLKTDWYHVHVKDAHTWEKLYLCGYLENIIKYETIKYVYLWCEFLQSMKNWIR